MRLTLNENSCYTSHI